MVKTLVIIVIIAAGAYLLLTQPWKPRRYNDTPAGKEAEATDEHVQEAFDWRPPDKADAATFLGSTPSKKVFYESMLGGMSFDEAHKLFDALRQAGASEVVFVNLHQSVREGAHPEGLVAVLPVDKTKRAAVFTAFKPGFQTAGKTLPPDVNQKYLYLQLSGDWRWDKPKPSLLGNNND
jgi:hypothetical protein